MVRGGIPGPVRLLSAAGTSEQTRALATRMLDGIGCTVVAESDPDLPMLLKNMRSASL
jgi:hypothetical protein